MAIKLVVSDFHLSRGRWLADGRRNPLEDFHQDERFREFLDFYSSGEYAQVDVELVINGDFFDPLAVIPTDLSTRAARKALEFPLEVEEEPAVLKFREIIAGHPVAFEALREFLKRGKRIRFRWGNHDVAILWPKVQALLRETLGHPARVVFELERYVFDRICIDHGHQFETLNHFDEQNIFITRSTPEGPKRIQNLPFGSFFVLGFLNRLKLERHYINQVQPFRIYLRLASLMEPWFFWRNGFRVAWFFVKMRLITHPMRFARIRKTLLLLKEALHRPSLEAEAEKLFFGPEGRDLPFDTLILGHDHQAKVRAFPGGKTYMNTGTWTPITSLDMATLGHRVLRTYALIEGVTEKGDGRARATLKVWHGRPSVTDDFS